MALATLANVKEFLHITGDGDNTLLTNILARVESFIKDYINFQFEIPASSFIEYHDGNGSNTVLLNNYPITELTSVYDDLDRVYGADTLLDAGDYVVYNEEGKIVLDGSFFNKGLRNIKVTYKAGYATIPSDLIEAVIKLVVVDYLEGQGAINAVPSAGGGFEVDTRPWQLRKEAMVILNHYRRDVCQAVN